MHFNSHMELDLCFRFTSGSLMWHALFTNKIFRQFLLLSYPVVNITRQARLISCC